MKNFILAFRLAVLSALLVVCLSGDGQCAPIEEEVSVDVANLKNVLGRAKQPLSLREFLAATNIVKPWTPEADAKKLIESESSLGTTYRLYKVGGGEIKDISLKGQLVGLGDSTVFDVTRVLIGYGDFYQVYQWKNGKYQKMERIERSK